MQEEGQDQDLVSEKSYRTEHSIRTERLEEMEAELNRAFSSINDDIQQRSVATTV